MNAYELADKLDLEPYGIYGEQAANMLRQQADRIAELENQLDKCSHYEAMAHQGSYEVGFEAGRQQGMKQERALWELAHSTQEIERHGIK